MIKSIATTVAALALAFGAPHAFADAVASATLSNFTISLIDLDTADGITPSIAFTDTSTSNLISEASTTNPVASDNGSKAGAGLFGAASSSSSVGVDANSFAVLSGNAFGGNLQLVQPTGNGLKLEQVKTKDGAVARFTGQTWLTGRFVAWWFGGANNTSDKTPEYVLIPDANGAANLPHFTLLYKHQRQRYLVKAIDLTNGEAALRLIVGDEQTRQLLDRRIDAVDVSGTFLLMDYEVGVECDAAWAHATFVKARIPSHLLASGGDVPEGC